MAAVVQQWKMQSLAKLPPGHIIKIEGRYKIYSRPSIIYRFCPHPRYPDEGYYQLQTTDGDFLGNIGSDELDYELSSFREQGYSLARIIEC